MLIDSFGRKINYIRLSVTEHCNYRCNYCREQQHQIFSPKKDILSYEQITKIIQIFATLGISKVRLTGGEPLLRKDIASLIRNLNNIAEIKQIPISTNGHLLSSMATKLYNSGVRQANISIDSLNKDKFSQITSGGDLDKVLTGIKEAKRIGMKIKLNMVVMDKINSDEILPMLDFALKNDLELRYIETMPIGMAGINASKKYYAKEQILDLIKQKFNITEIATNPTAGPAKMFAINNNKFGIISSISDNFCASCNRIRITAKGRMILCLGQENSLDLRQLLINNTPITEIKNLIISAVNKKPERHFFNNDINHLSSRQMVEIGG